MCVSGFKDQGFGFPSVFVRSGFWLFCTGCRRFGRCGVGYVVQHKVALYGVQGI